MISSSMFKPFLEITSSEFKRRVYLNNFVYYMFDQELIEDVNKEVEYSGKYFDNLLVDYHFETFAYEINEHTCRVIASFVSYLGTNGGLDYLNSAEHFKMLPKRFNKDAYELAWYYENTRRYGFNSGNRTIEYLLNVQEVQPSPTEHYFKKGFREPTVEDYETIEFVCKWLGTSCGQSYLKKCKTDIDLYQKIRDEIYEITNSK